MLKHIPLIKKLFYSFIFLLVIGFILIGCTMPIPEDKWYEFIYPSFFIKIEDQYGNPVENVEIAYTHGRIGFLYNNLVKATTFTNKKGLTEFKTDSRQFNFSNIHAQGYHIDFKKQLFHLKMNPGKRFLNEDLEKYTYNQPLIIQAWKFNNFPNLFFGHLTASFGNLNSKLAESSRLNINLLQNHEYKNITNNELWNSREGEFDITIKTVKSREEEHQRQWSLSGWDIEISVLEGGIQETDDIYLYRAPLKEYSEEWKVKYGRKNSAGLVNSGSRSYHKFYFKLRGGKAYGFLYLSTDIMPLGLFIT